MFALLRKRRLAGSGETTPKLTSVHRPAAHVIETAGEGRIFLLDIHRDRFLGLDDVGALIWRELARGSTIADIVAIVTTQYDGDPSVVENDVIEFVGALVEDGLVESA